MLPAVVVAGSVMGAVLANGTRVCVVGSRVLMATVGVVAAVLVSRVLAATEMVVTDNNVVVAVRVVTS